MTYLAYSDGGLLEGNGAITSIILTNKKYMGYKTTYVTGVAGSSQLELLGVLQSIELFRNLKLFGKLILLTDSESVALKGNAILKDRALPDGIKNRGAWAKFLWKCKDLTVELRYTEGHSINDNPNKFCDRLSYAVLRYYDDI